METAQTHPPFTEAERQALYKVQGILLQDFSKRHTNAALSRLAGLNRQKMNQGFKALFGHSVFVYAQQVRMREAKRLLCEEGLPIKQVAAMVGYNHTDNFITAFGRHFRETPARWRVRSPLLVSFITAMDSCWLQVLA